MEREREMDSAASDSESEVRAPAAVGPGVHQAVPVFECLAVLHADRQPVIPEPERGRQDGRTVSRPRRTATAPPWLLLTRGVVPAAADLWRLSQAPVKKPYVADPNARSLVQGVAGGLGASKEQAKKVKEATQKTRQDLRDHGAGPWIIHPDTPWLKVWDFVQAMVITYLFVGASLPALLSVLAS